MFQAGKRIVFVSGVLRIREEGVDKEDFLRMCLKAVLQNYSELRQNLRARKTPEKVFGKF